MPATGSANHPGDLTVGAVAGSLERRGVTGALGTAGAFVLNAEGYSRLVVVVTQISGALRSSFSVALRVNPLYAGYTPMPIDTVFTGPLGVPVRREYIIGAVETTVTITTTDATNVFDVLIMQTTT